MEEVKLDEYEIQEQAVSEIQTQGEAQVAEQPEPPKIDVEVLSQFVAFVTSRDLPKEDAELYQEKYKSFVAPVLKMIGFDKALGIYSFESMPPWMSILLGFGIMIGGVVILKPKPSKEEKKAESKAEPKPESPIIVPSEHIIYDPMRPKSQEEQ